MVLAGLLVAQIGGCAAPPAPDASLRKPSALALEVRLPETAFRVGAPVAGMQPAVPAPAPSEDEYEEPAELLPGPKLIEGKMIPGLFDYTQAQARRTNPPDRAGGPLQIRITHTGGQSGTRLVLPGPRFLDPAVFGTPDHPVGFDPAPFPLVGVPEDMRLVREGRYTMVNHPTPFSNWYETGTGTVKLTVVDHTVIDGQRTKDRIDMELTFKLPGPNPENPDVGATRYRVVCREPLPHGFGFPVFGGVVTNHILHGGTGLGTRLMPTEMTYVSTWGKGTVYKNDKAIAEDHMIHTMLSEIVRHGDYELNFDGEMAQRDPRPGKVLHLMVPPYKPGPEGMELAPLPTMFVPFPYIDRHLAQDFETARQIEDPQERERRLARLEEVKQLMEWTRKTVVEKVVAGEMAGMPFIHIMFSNLEVEYEHL